MHKVSGYLLGIEALHPVNQDLGRVLFKAWGAAGCHHVEHAVDGIWVLIIDWRHYLVGCPDEAHLEGSVQEE